MWGHSDDSSTSTESELDLLNSQQQMYCPELPAATPSPEECSYANNDVPEDLPGHRAEDFPGHGAEDLPDHLPGPMTAAPYATSDNPPLLTSRQRRGRKRSKEVSSTTVIKIVAVLGGAIIIAVVLVTLIRLIFPGEELAHRFIFVLAGLRPTTPAGKA